MNEGRPIETASWWCLSITHGPTLAAEAALRHWGYQTYAPRYRPQNRLRYAQNVQRVERPLIPNYVFLQPTDDFRYTPLERKGIQARIMRGTAGYLLIPEWQMDRVRQAELEANTTPIDKPKAEIKTGDLVWLIRDILKGSVASIRKGRVVVETGRRAVVAKVKDLEVVT